MKAAALLAAAVMAAPSAGFAAFPFNGLPPIASDPAAMAMANAAVGKPCRFEGDKVGPQVKGFANLPGVRQEGLGGDGFMFVRKRGPQRVAFLAREVNDRCVVRAAHPLPPAAAREMVLACHVDNPDPMVNDPLSQGLGLRQNGRRALVAYLEADLKAWTWTQRDPTDKRIKCSEFEYVD